MYLSKSDFKLASTCAKKLVYKKLSYRTSNDGNEYLEMLAEGGHIVSKLAQLLYPDGIEIKGSSLDQAIEQTRILIADNENITLFESTFSSQNKVVRVDVLEKKGNVFNLIEVKSKSHNSEEELSKVKKRLEEYIEDVAYQTLVLKELYPQNQVHSYLFLPDKSITTKIDGLAGWFRVIQEVDEKFEIDELPAQSAYQFKKPLVEFKYENDPNRNIYLDQLRKDGLLSLLMVDEDVAKIQNEIKRRADLFIRILHEGIRENQYSKDKDCKVCEFNLGNETIRNGYRECWKDKTDTDPHIFDLHFGGAIGHYKKGWYLDDLIRQGKVSFWDLDPERFKKSNGELGSRGERQMMQYVNTKNNTEFIHPGLNLALDQLKYPLHFIDFETYRGAIPHHRGLNPYGLVAFQWSCHTIDIPGAPPRHYEWLNSEYEFPNFKFAESLMKCIGSSGTPLMWSSFESSILREILEQVEVFGYSNEILKTWLTNITTDSKLGREGRFIDLHDFALKYYFHPEMKGKTSIKKVLPAIWQNNPYLHDFSWFSKYKPEDGISLNPYDTLSSTIESLENNEIVKDGTGAMKAYNDLMFGNCAQDEIRRQSLKKQLLQYCELDTMAMVIIWKYWTDKFVIR